MINNRKPIYIEEFEELFVDIQTQRILKDQKSFVDSVPKYQVKEILEAYRKEKALPHFDLKNFYATHFATAENKHEEHFDFATIEEHINHLWEVLTMQACNEVSTLILLPEKFVVPGGRFREIFYWDSYFTMLGLQVSKRFDLIESMIGNFAYLIDEFGFIPNGNRTYFLTRSQPPFFSLMVELLSEEKGKDVIVKYLPQLEKEYVFWMKGEQTLSAEKKSEQHVVRMPDGEILNRYWDVLDTPRPEGYMNDLKIAANAGKEKDIFRHIRGAAESGWDFSARWFEDGMNINTICACDIVPVDLNCLLFHLEKTLALAYTFKSEYDKAKIYYTKSERRKEAIQKYLWNEESCVFTDYNFLYDRPVRVVNIGMVYTMVFHIATQYQAACMQDQIEKNFLQPGGLLSTQINSGEQWDAPNGWAPLQWMTYKGMVNYNFNETAEAILNRWTKTIERVFKEKHKLTEKYNMVDTTINAGGGEYPNQDGFGWTNGVYLKFKSL